jgi:hypothetical protein
MQQETQLKKIIKNHLQSTKEITTTIYYNNKKVKNMLIKNAPKRNNNEELYSPSNVVYQYQCPEVECNSD